MKTCILLGLAPQPMQLVYQRLLLIVDCLVTQGLDSQAISRVWYELKKAAPKLGELAICLDGVQMSEGGGGKGGAGFDIFLKLRFLSNKVRLQEQNSATAASNSMRWTAILASCPQPSSWPQPSVNRDFPVWRWVVLDSPSMTDDVNGRDNKGDYGECEDEDGPLKLERTTVVNSSALPCPRGSSVAAVRF
jgi:hypothetical protein